MAEVGGAVMRKSGIGYLAALGATIIWAGNFVTARAVADAMPPCQFNFWRWVIAFCAILPFAWRHLRRDLPELRRHFRYVSVMALLGVTLMNAFVYKAGQTTESLNMALLMPATPIVIMVLARMVYGEAISGRRLLGMGIAACGIITLISRGDMHRLATLDFNSGDLWTMGCMLCFALYSLFMRQRPRAVSSLGFNAAVFGLGILYALPMVALEWLWLPLPRVSAGLLTGLAYAGLGCSAIAFWLWTVGIDRIGPVRAGIVYYSLPVFAAIGSMLVLGEAVIPAQVWGGVLIIGGICVATLPGRHEAGHGPGRPGG